MIKNLKNNGFASFVEVVVTTVIFLLAAFGIFSTISMLRPQSADSKKKLEAAYAAKAVIEDLYKDIDAVTWDSPTSNLAVGPLFSRQSSDGTMTIDYHMEDVPGLPLRKMSMTVTYPD